MARNEIRNNEIHLCESPDIRWFEKRNTKCICGKPATGVLRGTRNEFFGHYCDRCANKRLKGSEEARAFLAKHNAA